MPSTMSSTDQRSALRSTDSAFRKLSQLTSKYTSIRAAAFVLIADRWYVFSSEPLLKDCLPERAEVPLDSRVVRREPIDYRTARAQNDLMTRDHARISSGSPDAPIDALPDLVHQPEAPMFTEDLTSYLPDPAMWAFQGDVEDESPSLMHERLPKKRKQA